MENQPRRSIAYQFPVPTTDSVFFVARGAFIDKAVLSAGDTPLSIKKFHYSEDFNFDKGVPEDCEIRFFGEKPFHAALATKWNMKVVLFTRDDRTPSLIYIPAEKTITWADAGEVLYEKVTAGSEAGEVEKIMVYTVPRGGFKREPATSPAGTTQ